MDVLIIGGGVVGVACARELALRGASVTVLERDRVGYGCSFGNAGWLTPSQATPLANPSMLFKSFRWMLDPESPLYIQPRLDPGYLRWLIEFLLASRRSKFEPGTMALVALCNASVDMWEALAQRNPAFASFERNGLLAVYEHEASFAAAVKVNELMARAGVRLERWTADQVRDREPAIVGRTVGGYFFPDDAHCKPYEAVSVLADEARAAGVRFVERADVYGVTTPGAGPRTVKSTAGEFSAERIVLAAGSWSEDLGRMLDLRIPVLGAKGYSLLVPKANPHPKSSIYLIERKVAVNPHRDALRIAGTLELVKNDFSINTRRVEVIMRGAKGMLNIGDQPVVSELWRGLRPCTPDGMPVIGRAAGRGDVWLATGHQMAGLKTAPATGLLLAQLMSGETPGFDPAPFRGDRF
ncbi:MAG: NAD(P)/FAD-dependent oxidoreductase [Vicinamibacterales bacterium]